MRVQLIINWALDGKLEDPFWKFVEMPCLPPIGIALHLMAGDHDLFKEVTAINWSETRPGFYEVWLEEIETDEPREDTISWMNGFGWKHESQSRYFEAS